MKITLLTVLFSIMFQFTSTSDLEIEVSFYSDKGNFNNDGGIIKLFLHPGIFLIKVIFNYTFYLFIVRKIYYQQILIIKLMIFDAVIVSLCSLHL